MTGEPHLAPHDTGEWVLRLQTRLHALKLYHGVLDGSFGPTTETAVKEFQQHHAVTADGLVGPETWAAISHAEAAAGLHNPFEHGADPHAAPIMETAHAPVGTVSEDQHWRWDGERWQAHDGAGHGHGRPHDDHAAKSHLSTDGQWVWDGAHWQSAR